MIKVYLSEVDKLVNQLLNILIAFGTAAICNKLYKEISAAAKEAYNKAGEAEKGL